MTNKNDDIIDKYLRGEASEAEELQIHQQSNLKEELVFRQGLQNILGSESRVLMKQQLVNLDQKIVARQRMRRLFIVACIAITTILIGYIIWSVKTSPIINPPEVDATQIFAANFEPYPNIVAPIVKGNDTVSNREKAFHDYERGDYDEALPLFRELTIDRKDIEALFYQAIILVEREPKNAIQDFSRVISANHPTFKAPAQWYLAMTWLKIGSSGLAKVELEKIAKIENHPYQKKATQILEKF